MKGFSQKTNKMRRLSGDKPLNTPQPRAILKLPCPRWLKGEAASLWRSLAPQLIAAGVLTAWDKAAFQALCVSYGLMMQAARDLLTAGVTVPDRSGSDKKHPAQTIFRSNSDTFRKYCELFGIAPLARQRLDITIPDKSNALEELLDDATTHFKP